MSRYKNEIGQFFYEISYRPIWEAIASYLSYHLYSLDFTYSRMKYQDSAVLEEMVLEFPSDIRTCGDVLFFDAVVSCTVILTKEEYYERTSCETNQWLCVSCEATITDKLESFFVSEVENYVPDRRKKIIRNYLKHCSGYIQRSVRHNSRKFSAST